MTKEELLQKIDHAILIEEEAVPIYTEHMSTVVYWSGFDKKSVKEIHEFLKILHDDSIGHAKELLKVKRIIEKTQ